MGAYFPTQEKITWSSHDTSIATVNQTGLVIFKKTGIVYISATTDSDKRGGVYLTYISPSTNTLILPDGVWDIQYGAFEGLNSIKTVILPEGVIRIGHKAFANCNQLTQIKIPRSVGYFPRDAFENDAKLVITCVGGGECEYYANKYNIPYRVE